MKPTGSMQNLSKRVHHGDSFFGLVGCSHAVIRSQNSHVLVLTGVGTNLDIQVEDKDECKNGNSLIVIGSSHRSLREYATDDARRLSPAD